jgi:hypothetical protein
LDHVASVPPYTGESENVVVAFRRCLCGRSTTQNLTMKTNIHPELLSQLLPIEAPPIYCVFDPETRRFACQDDLGLVMTTTAFFAKVFSPCPGEEQIMTFDDAWPLLKDLIDAGITGGSPDQWIQTLRCENVFAARECGTDPLPVFCGVPESSGWSENLPWGPQLSLLRSGIQKFASLRGPMKALPWPEAWPLVRKHVLTNYRGQPEMCWATVLIGQQQTMN